MTELPHTRTRMVHWLSTTVALAAVVGASAFLQPPDATARPTTTAVADTGRPAPDATKATYPVDCGRPVTGRPAGVDVVDHGSADFDGDGTRETVAVVRCHSGTGTPPNGVFVLGAAARPGEAPRVVATMVSPKEGMTVQDLKVGDRGVSATLLGYSSPDVPRCCPDRQRKVKWEWRHGQFALVPEPVAGSAQSV